MPKALCIALALLALAYAACGQGRPKRRGAEPQETRIDLGNAVSFEMVLIPAGEFDMGSPGTEERRKGDETLHRVQITKPYWLATTELTQAAWEAVMGSNPASAKGPTLPVTDVSWDDAQAFVKRLNEKVAGGGFRLPTEAEWEYGCRAGSGTRFHFGDDEKALADYAWFVDSSHKAAHPVGLLAPNARGLFDMPGNVFEWCQDWYAAYGAVVDRALLDPMGPGSGEYRVARGGSWEYPIWGARSASRDSAAPGTRHGGLGFRPARTVTAN